MLEANFTSTGICALSNWIPITQVVKIQALTYRLYIYKNTLNIRSLYFMTASLKNSFLLEKPVADFHVFR